MGDWQDLQALTAGGHTGNFQVTAGFGRAPRRTIVSARRGRSVPRDHLTSVARVKAPRRARFIGISVLLLLFGGALASGSTQQGKDILAAVQRFLLFYSGVFALIALTAAVGVGVVATDRIVMAPGSRVVAQAVHRAVSLGALAFLATHIVLEVLARRSRAIDAFAPFLAHGRTFYIGIGTVASDLVVLLVVTGIARGRFARRWPWAWRAIHATAYLAWPMSIGHGLLAGRTAKPYVDWSYGACLVLVALALAIRLVASMRGGRQTAAQAVPHHASPPVYGAVPTVTQRELHDLRAAVPRAWRATRALPPAAGHEAAPPPQEPPYLAARRPSAPHPDQPGHPSGPWQYQPPAEAPDDFGEPSGCPSSSGPERR
jgi:hypothetical protein